MAAGFMQEFVFPKAPGPTLSVFILYSFHLRAHLASWLEMLPQCEQPSRVKCCISGYLWSTDAEPTSAVYYISTVPVIQAHNSHDHLSSQLSFANGDFKEKKLSH